jgi:ComF family protein
MGDSVASENAREKYFSCFCRDSMFGWKTSALFKVGVAATDLLFPPACANCLAALEASADVLLCGPCRQGLLQPGLRCPRCAMPIPEALAHLPDCEECRRRKPRFHAARTLGTYRDALRQMVLKIKHLEHEPLAVATGRLLARELQAHPFPNPPELVTAVPMYWLPRIWRGYHVPDTLASEVARACQLPLALDLLVCRRWLRKQSTLSTTERIENVRNAFRTSSAFDIRGATVLLIDDVITTAATASQAARALRRAGARAVYVAAVARGMGA